MYSLLCEVFLALADEKSLTGAGSSCGSTRQYTPAQHEKSSLPSIVNGNVAYHVLD